VSQLDPRRYPFRIDIAADSLKHIVRAARYVLGDVRQVKVPIAGLRRSASPDAGLDTEALYGEKVTVYEDTKSWSWVQLRNDGYVGYLPSDTLRPVPQDATHRIGALRALVFKEPDIKSPVLKGLSFGSMVNSTGAGKFIKLDDGGFVHLRHTVSPNDKAADYVSVAERYIGSPYFWGGKTSLGIDCSGLVQVAMTAAGHFCPRDSYMQQAEVGLPRDVSDIDSLQRGDLVFWKGHVGIMRDSQRLLHANAHFMEVCVEPLAAVIVRMAALGSTIAAIRRPAALGM
jgi:cell wall-associated NlpC family hydrolase